MASPETLTSVIEDLKQRIRAGSFRSEAEISSGVVIRILNKLDWPIFDTRVVTPEFKIGSRKVDYALCHPPGKPSVLLEVKDLGKADGKGEMQLFEYCFHQGVPIAVLTDGRSWSFFFPSGQGSYKERRFAKVDLVGDNSENAAKTLSDYLQAQDVKSGEALKRVQRDYEAARKEKAAASKYGSVWRRLLAGPESLLLDLFREEVEQETGVRPNRTRAAAFIRAQAAVVAELPTRTKAPKSAKGKLGPNGGTKDMSTNERLCFRFFEGLLEHAKSKTQLHANISPSKDTWVWTGAGIPRIHFMYAVRQRDSRIQLYIDTLDGNKNRRIFDALLLRRETIESAFGAPLDWLPLDGQRSCRIKKTYATGGYLDEDVWEAVYEELATAMAKLELAITPHLKGL